MKTYCSSLSHSFLIGTVVAVLLGGLSLLSGCHEGSEGQLKETVDSFAEAYFNWQFPRAVAYCTPSSRQWLSYASSQVNQFDVDTLRAMDRGAEHSIEKIDYQGDSLATALVTVRHFMAMDSLGHAGQLVDEARYVLPMVYEDEAWKVRLTGLPRPQSER